MERNKVLDAAKYLLIVLVVLGHFIEPSRYSNPISCHIYCLIYSFHMPLFIIISGYFYKQRSITEEIKKCSTLLEICLLSHIGFLLIQNGLNISIKNLLYFGGDPAWFLLCLIYWRIGTNVLLKYLTAKHILEFAIVLDLISFFIIKYGGFFSITRAIAFYPFFMIGYCLKNDLMEIITKYRKVILIAGVLSMLFVLLTASVLQFRIHFQLANVFELMQYTDWNANMIFVYRYALLLCALCIGGFVLVLINRSLVLQKFSIFGTATLFIYYMHSFIFAWIKQYDLTLWQSLSIVLITIPVLTYLATRQFAPYIMNPVTQLIDLVKERRSNRCQASLRK